MTAQALRILNLEPEGYSPAALAILDTLGEIAEGPLSRSGLVGQIPGCDVLIVRLAHQIDREVLERADRLKVIVTATTGLDHVDVEFAESMGITVLSLRGETDFLRGVPATAEHTWALLLALVRHLPAAFRSVLDGEWDRDRFKGHDLAGKTLGVLGLGRIGEKVARYGLAFGMRVLAYDPFREGWVEQVGRAASRSDLLRQSDILSVHVPLNDETIGLIGDEEFASLPAGALLINTSRGQVVDEPALLRALQSGRLAGAALDVLADERAGTLWSSPLIESARRHPNLIITPHIGGATVESMAATEVFMAHKLRLFLQK